MFDDSPASPPRYRPFDCDSGNYEIEVQVSSDIFSGTDDNVEVRIYGKTEENVSITTPWFKLNSGFNDFQRLSKKVFCVKSRPLPFHSLPFIPMIAIKDLTKIGIRKSGSDDLKLNDIRIRDQDGPPKGFYINQWITDEQEHIFHWPFHEFKSDAVRIGPPILNIIVFFIIVKS